MDGLAQMVLSASTSSSLETNISIISMALSTELFTCPFRTATSPLESCLFEGILIESASVAEKRDTDLSPSASESVSASVLPKKEIAKTELGKIIQSENFIIKDVRKSFTRLNFPFP